MNQRVPMQGQLKTHVLPFVAARDPLLLESHYSVAKRPVGVPSSHCPKSLEKGYTISALR